MAKKVQIAFDLDTQKLKEIYSPLTGKEYNNAYFSLRSSFEKCKYTHRQGSVYHSTKGKTRIGVLYDLKKIIKENTWFPECVKRIDYGYLEDVHDLMIVVEKYNKKKKKLELNLSSYEKTRKVKKSVFKERSHSNLKKKEVDLER